jgi:hypothetical protein
MAYVVLSVSQLSPLRKESLNSDGYQFAQYQQTNKSPLKPGIHDTSFASKSPFKKTWIKKT